MANVSGYLIRAGDAVSQLLNVLVFNGDSNYSVSGDAHRFKREWLQKTLDKLFARWETDHCRKAHENDVNKAMLLLKENPMTNGGWRFKE